MVFFTCEQCAEALKKNQVAKHCVSRCGSNAYSCIDCQKVFDGYTYAQHIKCISEDQKYGGLGYVEKPKKGELKQESWVEQVSRAIDRVPDADQRLRQLLQRIQQCTNIPRKEAKFMNFLKNSFRIRQDNLCRLAWSYIMAEMKQPTADDDTPKQNGRQNGKATADASAATTATNSGAVEETAEPPAAKQRKRPADGAGNETSAEMASEEEEKNQSGDQGPDGKEQAVPKFKWKSMIKRKLRESDGYVLKFKRLRRAVVDEYRLATADGGQDEDDEALFAQFANRLAAIRGVQIDGKLVSLAPETEEE